MKYAFITNNGGKDHNEDAVLIGSNLYTQGIEDGENETLFAVADGVSGSKGGDIASSTLLKVFGKLMPSNEAEVLDAISIAKKEMQEIGNLNTEFSEMATTISGVIINDHIEAFNLGDSPIYIMKFNALRKISHEDTLYHDLLAKHQIAEDDEVINRHIITKYVASYKDCELNYKKEINLAKGDMILISSDGLTDFVPDEIIERVLKSDSKIIEKIKGLFDLAMAKKSSDNISIILIEI